MFSLNRTSILSPKGDSVTSMRPVNTITDYVSVVRLNDEIQTKFDDTKQVMEKEQAEQEQAQEQSRERHHARLLNFPIYKQRTCVQQERTTRTIPLWVLL